MFWALFEITIVTYVVAKNEIISDLIMDTIQITLEFIKGQNHTHYTLSVAIEVVHSFS